MKKKQNKTGFHFCFRRWSRKKYSAFLSMHKVVKVGVLSVGLSIITLSAQDVFAQTDTTQHGKTTMLDESLVVGRRADALPGMVRILSSLSEAQLELAPAQSVNDLLRYLPSVDLRQRGPSGVQADISVRGGTFEQTQVLLNGVNFSDPQTGHYSLDLPIDVGLVSGVEILQGLSAPGAIGGALNLTTDPSLQSGMRAYLSGGQYGYLNAAATLGITKQRLQTFLSASHSRSDGYTTNTDFGITNLFSFLQYNTAHVGKLEAQLGYQQKTYGANGFYSFKYPNQLEAVRCFLGSLRWQKELGQLHVSATAYHREHFDRFELFRNNPDSWYTGHNYHQTLLSGAELSAQLQSKLGLSTLSAELRNEHIYSNTLGYPMDTPRPAPFEDSAYYTKHANRNTLRVFASHQLTFDKLSLTGGASLHYSSQFDSKLCFAFDVRQLVSKYVLVYAAANQALRLPTFTDLYYQTATHEANPNLQPEDATTFELGTRYLKGSLKASASVFYRFGRNTIDWVYVEGAAKSTSLNYSEINTAGTELSAQWLPTVKRPDCFLRRVGLSYAFTYIDRQSTEHGSSLTLDLLRHKANLDVEHLLGAKWLKAQWQLGYFDRNGSYVDASTGATIGYKPVLLVNLRVQCEQKALTIFAEALNLLGTTYFDFGGIIQPKQQLSAGVKVQL